jgi:acid phosphatase (class A)
MNYGAVIGLILVSAAGVCPLAAEVSTENVMHAVQPAGLAAANFVNVGGLDFKAVLPEPPAMGSLAAEADLMVVRQAQAWRTAEEVAWAKLVERDDVFNHASLIGDWFTKERLPRLAEFFRRIGEDMRAMDGAAKRPFLRPRPTTVDASLRPCVTLPASTSYPSGSAMQAWVWGELLAEIFPFRREEILERAERAAWGRVIGGVHFPSDLIGGKRLASVYLAEAWKNAEFQVGVEASRAEMMRVALENIR